MSTFIVYIQEKYKINEVLKEYVKIEEPIEKTEEENK